MKNELKNLFTDYWKFLAVNAACELKLFDKIASGENSLSILCKENKWDSECLQSLICFCVDDGFIKESSGLEITEKGNYLLSNNPDGLHYACLHWADEHLIAWQNLSFTIQTGKSAFEKQFGTPYFDYLNGNRERLSFYHKAMAEYAHDDYKNISSLLLFKNGDSVLDIGGGSGVLIKQIKKDSPALRCGIFDLPEVISQNEYAEIETYKGDFFVDIPIGFNYTILSRVLHDWDDIDALRILHNAQMAIDVNQTLIIIENLTDKMEHVPHLLSLNMKTVCTGKERTSTEYISLLSQSGFMVKSIIQLNYFQSIIFATRHD